MSSEPYSLYLSSPDDTDEFFLVTQPVMSIGRAPDNPIVLDHTLISRRHAELRLDPDGLLITDLNSTNGTFVNGERLGADRPYLLRNGAEINIGPFSIVVIDNR